MNISKRKFSKTFCWKNRNAIFLVGHWLEREFRIFVVVFFRQAHLKKSKQIFDILNSIRPKGWAIKDINHWFVTDEFVQKDLATKDVPLKYEKSGGTVWVSLDQFKSSPEKVSSQPKTSPNKAPTKVSSSNLQNSTNYMASQEKPSPLSFQGDTS